VVEEPLEGAVVAFLPALSAIIILGVPSALGLAMTLSIIVLLLVIFMPVVAPTSEPAIHGDVLVDVHGALDIGSLGCPVGVLLLDRPPAVVEEQRCSGLGVLVLMIVVIVVASRSQVGFGSPAVVPVVGESSDRAELARFVGPLDTDETVERVPEEPGRLVDLVGRARRASERRACVNSSG